MNYDLCIDRRVLEEAWARINQPQAKTPTPSPVSSVSTRISSAASSSISQAVSATAPKKCFSWSLNSRIGRFFAKIQLFIHSFFHPQLHKAYFGLGSEKWKECIDGRYHAKEGKYVFDQALHNGTKEPGFLASMENAFTFVGLNLHRKLDADLFLELHKVTCAHFDGNPDIYLMGQEKVGVFRGQEDWIHYNTGNGPYKPDQAAITEFYVLDAELKRTMGPDYGLGAFVLDYQTGGARLDYKEMTREQVRKIFDKFIADFDREAAAARNDDEKIMAVAKLQQRLEWLHPVRDGTSRTSVASMNLNLTRLGLHPAILEYPHKSSVCTLQEWFNYLKAGVKKWEDVQAALNRTRA